MLDVNLDVVDLDCDLMKVLDPQMTEVCPTGDLEVYHSLLLNKFYPMVEIIIPRKTVSVQIRT